MNPKLLNAYIMPMDSSLLKETLALVWEVFLEFEAPVYSEEGIKSFQDFIAYDAIRPLVDSKVLVFYVCVLNKKIIGAICLKRPNHISLLFVKKEYQRQGVASGLFASVCNLCFLEDTITVNSSPYAVPVYQKWGFEKDSEELIKNGIRYTPMTYNVKNHLKTFHWVDFDPKIHHTINSWLFDYGKRSEMIRKQAMFDSTFTDEYHYYKNRKDFLEGHIADYLKVVYLEDVLIAYLVMPYYEKDKVRYLSINPLVIHPRYQGMGYGKAVVFDVIKNCPAIIKNPVDYLECSVSIENPISLKLFQSLGFEQYGSSPDGSYIYYRFAINRNLFQL